MQRVGISPPYKHASATQPPAFRLIQTAKGSLKTETQDFQAALSKSGGAEFP
nr:hypothetical protein [uncultured Kingella sp.]